MWIFVIQQVAPSGFFYFMMEIIQNIANNLFASSFSISFGTTFGSVLGGILAIFAGILIVMISVYWIEKLLLVLNPPKK